MALILIRSDNDSKIVESIRLLRVNRGLRLLNQPKFVKPSLADNIARHIMDSRNKKRSSCAVTFFVEGDDYKSISSIIGLNPPAHIIVVSKEYGEYSLLEYIINNGKSFNKLSFSIVNNVGMIDYISGENPVFIKKIKSSYIFK